jgi:hypothetical protein
MQFPTGIFLPETAWTGNLRSSLVVLPHTSMSNPADVPAPLECWLGGMISILVAAAGFRYLQPFPKDGSWSVKVMILLDIFEIVRYLLWGYNVSTQLLHTRAEVDTCLQYTVAGWGPVDVGRMFVLATTRHTHPWPPLSDRIYPLDVFTTTFRVTCMHFGLLLHAADGKRTVIAAVVIAGMTAVSGCCAILAYIIRPELVILRPFVGWVLR